MSDNDLKWIEINKLPSMPTLFNQASKAFDDLSSFSDKVILKIWVNVNISHYIFKRGIEPKGFIWSRHRHLIHQIGSIENLNKISHEFTKRGLNKIFGLDIDLQVQ